MTNNKPKFSVVLITKDESKTLPKLLKSLEHFKERGGQVAICDTGSTDGTIQIAKEWGCIVDEVGSKYLHNIDAEMAKGINDRFIVDGEAPVVFEGDKYFDFASARNHAASLASNDVVSFADADEEFTKMDIDKLNELVEGGYEQFEYSFVFAHDEFGQESIKFVQSKMYDRRVMKWTGLVHEVLEGDAKRIYVGESIFKLEHWQNQETNRHSYLKGLAVDCFLNQDKDRNSHYYSRELMWYGRPKSAIKEFERHIAMDKWPAEKSQSQIFIGDCYGQLGNPQKQVIWYSKAFYTDSGRREPLIKLARFYQAQNNPRAALCYAKAAMEIPWADFYANTMSHYTYEPHEIMYWAYGWLGDVQKAQEHILKCLEYQPLNQKYLDDTKYYFDYSDHNIEGWMTFPELQFLYNMSKQVRTVAEIGSWKGRSTHALLSGGSEVTAIDHFQGSEDVRDGTHGGKGVFEQFTENTKGFSNLKVKKMSGDEASQGDDVYDLVFIDAGHSYNEVVSDIRHWKDKAKVVLCGHDYSDSWPETMKAVNDELGDVMVCDTIWYKFLVPTVSIIIPQLGRPEGLQKCLESITKLKYPHRLIDVKVIEGEDTVPNKVKRGVQITKGEYVCFMANDTEFEPNCLIEAVLDSQKLGKSLVSFNEDELLPDKGNICTHFIIKRDLIKEIDGEIFDTEFNHIGVDNLLWAKCDKLGQAHWCKKAKILHKHFSKGYTTDDIYKKGWDKAEHDRALLKRKLSELNLVTN